MKSCINIAVLILLVLGIQSCAMKKLPENFEVATKILEINAHDLEEDQFAISTGADEVLLIYSLTGEDPCCSGISQLGYFYDGNVVRETIIPENEQTNLVMRPGLNEKAKFHLHYMLIEVDDTHRIKPIMDTLDMFTQQPMNYDGMTGVGDSLPMNFISRLLMNQGVSLTPKKFTSGFLMQDDLLGQGVLSLKPRKLQKHVKKGKFCWFDAFVGENLMDPYHYSMRFELLGPLDLWMIE